MEATSSLLNLACGGQAHPDWTNVDYFPPRVRYNVALAGPLLRALEEGRASYRAASGATVRIADLRKGIPFPDASFDVVYHSNFLEHLERPAAQRFLAECRRVLRPGGIMRVVVPDLEEKARAYLTALDDVRAGAPGAGPLHEFAVLDLIDQMVRTRSGGELGPWLNAGWPERREPPTRTPPPKPGDDGRRSLRYRLGKRLIGTPAADRTGELHRWMYDAESLARELAGAGFARPAFMSYDESSIEHWDRYRLDERPDGSPLHHACIYGEARR